MTVRSRLVLTILGISVLMALPAGWAVTRLQELNRLTTRQVQRHAQARIALGKLNTSMAELERFARGYIIDGTEQQRGELERTIGEARGQLAELKDFNYRPVLPGLSTAEAQLSSIAES